MRRPAAGCAGSLWPASTCDEIQFTLHGQRQAALIDSTPELGMAFIERVQRLLGVSPAR